MGWARARAFIVRRADHAGGSTVPWIIVAILAGVELMGTTPITADWPAQDTTIARGVSAASQFLWEHTGAVLTGRRDPFGAWVEVFLPARSQWLAVAAVPVLIAVMLAVVREHRATTMSSRALRLAAAGVAYLVVAVYVRHLVVWLLNPVAHGLLSVHIVLLVIVVAGIAVLTRWVVGRPTVAQRVPGRTKGARLRAGLVVLGAVALGAALAGVLPLPTYRPVLDEAAAAADTYRSVVGDGVAYVGGGTATTVRVSAIKLADHRLLWTVQLPIRGDAAMRLSRSDQAAYVELAGDAGGPVYALAASDGRTLWTRTSARVHVFAIGVLVEDLQQHQVVAIDDRTGATVWSRPHVSGSALHWSGEAATSWTPPAADRVAQVDPDGTVRILKVNDGSIVAQRARLVPAAATTHVGFDRLLSVAPRPDGYSITAYGTADLKKPVWTYSAPPGSGHPVHVTTCGSHHICVTDSTGVTALGSDQGDAAWTAVGGDLPGGPVQGPWLIRWPTRTEAVANDGTLIATFFGARVYPLAPSQLLLLSDDGTVALFDLSTLDRLGLGTASLDPAACSWNAAYLVCSGPTIRAWSLPG